MTRPFKVLIAGGSLTGLALALALEHAGIDFELLEKGEFAPQLGASIVMHPQSIRMFDQLGVWDDMGPFAVPFDHARKFNGYGHCFEDTLHLRQFVEVMGWPIIFIERRRLLQILHEHIKDKGKVHDHTAIASYEESEDEIVVTTVDGRSFRGDILIGADGIHSHVRRMMSEWSHKKDSDTSEALDGDITCEYKCFFGISRDDPESRFLPEGDVHNVYGNYFSTVVARGRPDIVFWFIFIKTSLTKSSDSPRFTEEDALAVLDRYGSVLLGTDYTVRDLWNKRIKSDLVAMEDGIIKKWSSERVLLMGDSAHKVTINAGLGGNLCLEAVAQFTNALVPLLEQNSQPSPQDLTGLFGRFEQAHRPRAVLVRDGSIKHTRYETQDTWFLKLYARVISPWMSDKKRIVPLLALAQSAPWLEFLPLPAQDVDLPNKKKKEEEEAQKLKPRIESFRDWSVFGGGAVLVMATVAAIWWRSTP